MNPQKDSIYANPLGEVDSFKFDEKVVNVFPDMIERSVPGYRAIINAIGLLAEKFYQENTRCYDLGCSLGAASLSMHHHIARPCEIIAVDSSAAMLNGLQTFLRQSDEVFNIRVECADIRDIAIENASVAVVNFTLQFLPIADRQSFIEKVYQGLQPGGILILSEKLEYDDPRQQTLQTDLHHLFKQSQGYSELEISQKRSALENVLLTETFDQHRARLLNAGFSSVEIWFQYFNFASMIALK